MVLKTAMAPFNPQSESRCPPDAADASLGVVVGEREHRLYVLKSAKIEWIESQGNYVKFRCGGCEYISRDSIKRLAAALAGDGFIRIGRCLMINIRFIEYAQRLGRRIYIFTMLSGAVLRSDPRYRDEILRVLPLTQGRPRAKDTLRLARGSARVSQLEFPQNEVR
jgi:LytTr DNA-binding domain